MAWRAAAHCHWKWITEGISPHFLTLKRQENHSPSAKMLIQRHHGDWLIWRNCFLFVRKRALSLMWRPNWKGDSVGLSVTFKWLNPIHDSMMLPTGAGRHYCQINSKTKGHPSIFFYFLVFLIGFEYGSSHLSSRYLSRKLIDYGILWNVEIHLETLPTGSWFNGWADDLEMHSLQLQSPQQV